MRKPAEELFRALGPIVSNNWLERHTCLRIRRIFESQERRHRTFQGRLQLDRRFAEFAFVPPELDNVLDEYRHRVLEDTLGLRFGTGQHQAGVVYRYPVGPGFEVHHDVVTQEERRSALKTGAPVVGGDLTLVAFLSDPTEYTGGELCFPSHGMVLRAPIGTVVTYPASHEFLHGVNPITAGERFSLVKRFFFADGGLHRSPADGPS